MNPPETDLELSHDLLEVRGSGQPSGPVPRPAEPVDPDEPTRLSQPTRPAQPAGRTERTEQQERTETAALVAEASSLTDRTLGDFRLLRKLGSGGMADVYLAEQLSLKRKVAIKVLRPELVRESDDVMLKRFEREARAAAGLTHPNIVQVYTIGTHEGLHYIAQEYVEGLNLREFLKRKGPPDAHVAVHLMRQVASALAKAGEAGIVHRDIKPENILITRRGQVKVGDFGLAQLTQPGDRVHLTQPNITMGTPLYMSPEQVNGRPLDQRSDIYSLGVTCYHLLTGGTPFRGETALSVAVQHLNQQPRSLSELRADLPPALCAVVHRMMAKKPEDRYPDAGSIVQDLKLIATALKQQPQEAAETLAKFAGLVPLTAPPRGLWGRMSRWSVRGWVAAVLGVGMLLGSASAGLGWWLRPANPLESPPRNTSGVSRLSSAEAQFTFALIGTSGTEDEERAFQAVIEFHREDEQYCWMAREQLAMIYLRSLRLGDAEKLFEQFAREGEVTGKRDLKARAEAGRAVIANLRGDYARSQQIMDRRLLPGPGSESLLNELERSSELRRYVEQARTINQQRLRGAL